MPFVNVIQPSSSAPAIDWTDNNIGSFLNHTFDTNGFRWDYDYHYPLDAAYRQVGRMSVTSSSVLDTKTTGSYRYTPEGVFATPANQILSAPYCAVWCPPEHTAAGGASPNDSGWYLFERNGAYVYSTATWYPEGSTPAANGRALYQPLAWPSGANDNDGYMSVGGSNLYKYFFSQISSYSGPTGSGGTDSWSSPFDWSSPRYTVTATLTTGNGTNTFNLTNISESGAIGDFEPYGSTPLRFNSQTAELLWNTTSGGTYSGGIDFFSKTELNHGRLRNLTTGFDIWNNSFYRYFVMGDSNSNEPWGAGTLGRWRYVFFNGGGTTALSNFSVGDQIQFDLFFSDI